MPRDFDGATVQRLLDTVSEPRTASVLKLGYFSRRGKPSLPVVEGYALLKNALAREPAGSNRWFLLQEVRGWAAFRAAGVPQVEGFEAYEAILAHAQQAKAARASYSLSSAIRDYAFSAASGLTVTGSPQDKRPLETLNKAWTAYFSLVNGRKGSGAEPLWAEAIAQTQSGASFLSLVEKTLADPQVDKTYGLLTASAAVFQPTDPTRALALLRQARPMVPADDMEKTGRFYDQFVALLLRKEAGKSAVPNVGTLDEAISLQQERIRLTGIGRGLLAALYLQTANVKGIVTLLAELERPMTKESEINDVAQTLQVGASQTTDENSRANLESKVVHLLNEYLARPMEPEQISTSPTEASSKGVNVAGKISQRVVDVSKVQRLRARYLLARVYTAQKRWAQAIAVLDVPDLHGSVTSNSAHTYSKLSSDLLQFVRDRATQRVSG